jgi:hypothetical protein
MTGGGRFRVHSIVVEDFILIRGAVEGSATPGAVRSISSFVASSSSTTTTATLVAVRGEADAYGTLTGSDSVFLYGAEGKLVVEASSIVNIGSGYACGVLGQIDISHGGTLTSGHIACVIASVQSGSSLIGANGQVNGVYVEAPAYGSGGGINSILQGVGSVNTVFDVAGVSAATLFTLASSGHTPYLTSVATNGEGKIEILLNGSPAYINVYSS